MNQRVVDEAAALVELPKNAISWGIVDIGEGHRTLSSDREQYEEEIYKEITDKVDELVKGFSIDPRLNDIDDCLYRVAARALVVQNNKILLVKEAVGGTWWALPGGGVDHGETVESSLVREVEEELGVPASEVSSDFQIVHYNIGNVVNAVPRMNLFFKVSVPENLIIKTDHVSEWKWFTKDEFMRQEMHPSYDKTALVDVIFNKP
jgi:8-oxo-dGTP pyrophosphatase MutT (NUDIX family)